MAKVDPLLVDILKRYDLTPKDALWDCHGTLVIYHRYLERIAAKAGITYDPPQIIEAKSADKIVAICVVGRMDGRSEWSIGEAAPGNNKNSYPYAMAEKRAKDRVILKLVGLAGFVYSEDEADDFKNGPKGAVEVETPPAAPPPASKAPPPPSPSGKGNLFWIEADGSEVRFEKGSDWFAHALKKLRAARDPAPLWAVNGKTAGEIVERTPNHLKGKAEGLRDQCIRAVDDARDLTAAA
jgi:hypothetical protein